MPKSMKEKLDEIIPLLKKLNEVGIPSTDDGYKMTKALMDVWLRGDHDILNEEIHFMKYGRIGYLSMYSKYKKPSFVLKATEELKEYIDRTEAEEEEGKRLN